MISFKKVSEVFKGYLYVIFRKCTRGTLAYSFVCLFFDS